MRLYGVAIAVILLPLLGIGFSYLADTRRGISVTVLAGSLLSVVASLFLVIVVVAHASQTHQLNLAFWSYGVTVTPFNAATSTVLASTFQLSLGYSAGPMSATLALVTSVVVFLCQAHFQDQLRRDSREPTMMRLLSLVGSGALAAILAASLFQVLVGFELAGFAAFLTIGAARTTPGGVAARRGYLIWRAAALSLLLAVVFIYVKFSGAITAAAASGHKQVAFAGGLNLASLAQIWVATTHGLAHGVGGRTLTLSGSLLLLTALAAAGVFPFHGLWRTLAAAPGSAAALLASVPTTLLGPVLLLQTYTLFTVASGVLPALAVAAAVGAVATALLAASEHQLRRMALWISASQVASAVAALGVGAPAAGVAMLVSSALTAAALLATTSSLGRDFRLQTISQLGPAFLHVRSSIVVFLLALASGAGLAGTGTFFARTAILAAVVGGASKGSPTPEGWIRLIAGIGVGASGLLLAFAGARVLAFTIRRQEIKDPRESRLLRRQLAQPRAPREMWASIALTSLALLSGLVALPAVGVGLGAFLSRSSKHTSLPFDGLALLIALLVPVAGAALGFLTREALEGDGEPEPQWRSWVDGSRISLGAEAVGIGLPAAGLQWAVRQVAQPAADAATGFANSVLRVGSGERPLRLGWSTASGPAIAAVVLLSAAVIIWVASGHPAPLRLP